MRKKAIVVRYPVIRSKLTVRALRFPQLLNNHNLCQSVEFAILPQIISDFLFSIDDINTLLLLIELSHSLGSFLFQFV